VYVECVHASWLSVAPAVEALVEQVTRTGTALQENTHSISLCSVYTLNTKGFHHRWPKSKSFASLIFCAR